MLQTLLSWPPVWLALLATLFTWGVTAAGAGIVFAMRRPSRAVLNGMLGFSAGVMLAASFWSLLSPAIETALLLSIDPVFPLLLGFLCGGLVLLAGDRFFYSKSIKNINLSSDKRCTLLIFSITLHNIPEGLAVGVAFGALSDGSDTGALTAACMLALGIGLQNFPEGAAVSVPLLREGYTKRKAFLWGQCSGLVEPVAGILGALLVSHVRALLPFLLSFAAGAMIYVVTEELIPESQKSGRREIMTMFTIFGFAVMMLLDVALS